MKPAPFTHHGPRTLDEAVATLAEVGHDGKVLAGGQSLIPILSMRLAAPAHLVDINEVAGLDTLEVREDCVRVGATVRHRTLELHDEAFAALPILRQALENVAHPVIRNRGTTVGSIAHADAAGEMPSIAALTNAVVEVASSAGAREVPIDQFFLGPLETVLDAAELVTAVRFGLLPAGTRTAFTESARRHGDYAMAGVGVALTVVDGIVSAARCSFVSVTDVPDVLDVSDAVRGLEPGGIDWSVLEDLVDPHLSPETDIHASAEYRRMLAVELTKRTFAKAAAAQEVSG